MNKKNRQSKLGCLSFGCLGVICALMLAGVLLFFGAKLATNYAVEGMTDDQPAFYEPSSLSDDEIARLLNDFQKFLTRAELGIPTEPFELKTPELNTLLEHSSRFTSVKEMIRFNIESDILSGIASIPTELLKQAHPVLEKMDSLGGRYLIADVRVTAKVSGGKLELYLKEVTVKGKDLPSYVESKLIDQNVLREDVFGSEFAAVFKHVRSFTVQESKVILIGSGGTIDELMNSRE
ncbi:MAG: hypothetical protein HOD39_12315 [Verrucomicrobia bacterium]|nr:hypothetical protein [Verrucomicrobiota bacterium]